MVIPYQTAKFKPIAILGSTAKFNSHQYLRLYGIKVPLCMDHFDDTSHGAQLPPSLSLSLIVDIILGFSITALLLLLQLSMILLTAMTMVMMTVVGFLLTTLSY